MPLHTAKSSRRLMYCSHPGNMGREVKYGRVVRWGQRQEQRGARVYKDDTWKDGQPLMQYRTRGNFLKLLDSQSRCQAEAKAHRAKPNCNLPDISMVPKGHAKQRSSLAEERKGKGMVGFEWMQARPPSSAEQLSSSPHPTANNCLTNWDADLHGTDGWSNHAGHLELQQKEG